VREQGTVIGEGVETVAEANLVELAATCCRLLDRRARRRRLRPALAGAGRPPLSLHMNAYRMPRFESRTDGVGGDRGVAEMPWPGE